MGRQLVVLRSRACTDYAYLWDAVNGRALGILTSTTGMEQGSCFLGQPSQIVVIRFSGPGTWI